VNHEGRSPLRPVALQPPMTETWFLLSVVTDKHIYHATGAISLRCRRFYTWEGQSGPSFRRRHRPPRRRSWSFDPPPVPRRRGAKPLRKAVCCSRKRVAIRNGSRFVFLFGRNHAAAILRRTPGESLDPVTRPENKGLIVTGRYLCLHLQKGGIRR
jgi:hypothetical protein